MVRDFLTSCGGGCDNRPSAEDDITPRTARRGGVGEMGGDVGNMGENPAGSATPGPWQFYPEALSEFAGQHAALKHIFRKEKKLVTAMFTLF